MQKAILIELQDIFRNVFDDDHLQINGDTCSGDIEEWDSLSHMELIQAVEIKYNIRFGVREIKDMKNVGDFVDTIIYHINEMR